jgi:hypothetical protein
MPKLLTLDKSLVEQAMIDTGFTENIINQVTRPGFYKEVMTAKDPDSEDIFKLYGILKINQQKGGSNMTTADSTATGPAYMIDVDADLIAKRIRESGWGISEFAEFSGFNTMGNINYMLKRGTMKLENIQSIAHVLGMPCAKIAPSLAGTANDNGVPAIPTKLLEKIKANTVPVNKTDLQMAMKKSGVSYAALAGDLNVPEYLMKDILASGGRIPKTSDATCKRKFGFNISGLADPKDMPVRSSKLTKALIQDSPKDKKEEEPVVATPIAKKSGKTLVSHSRIKKTKAEELIEKPAEETKVEQISMPESIIGTPDSVPETEAPVSEAVEKSTVKEETHNPEDTRPLIDRWNEFLAQNKEQRELMEYLNQQHKKESMLRTNEYALQERKKSAVHDGMISINALTTMVNMFNENPDLKDFLIDLTSLPSEKRETIINALHTLIVAML